MSVLAYIGKLTSLQKIITNYNTEKKDMFFNLRKFDLTKNGNKQKLIHVIHGSQKRSLL